MSGGIARITAGILSYNRRDSLRRTLEAVLAIPGLRVLVIDNASTDGSVDMLRREYSPAQYPQLRVLFLAENLGVAATTAGRVRRRTSTACAKS
jgi:GT2 family glycosyltransferase